MRFRRLLPKIGLLSLLLLTQFVGGCARPAPVPPGQSGIRLLVTMTYYGQINLSDYYYFVINVPQIACASQAGTAITTTGSAAENAQGPVAIYTSPSLNGFATGANNSAAGFTDFVVFNTGLSAAGVGLFHVVGNPNNSTSFSLPRIPVSYSTGDPTCTSYCTLTFEIDLAQLIYDRNGNVCPGNEAASMAQDINWIQFNIISTTLVPATNAYTTGGALIPGKYVDALGNTTDGPASDAANSFVSFNVQTTQSISNSYICGQGSELCEIQGDVWPSEVSSIDLTDWSVTVVHQ